MSKTIVICVNNGQQFPTIAAAAEWAGVDRRRIRDAIQRGTQAAGRRWGRINLSDLNEP